MIISAANTLRFFKSDGLIQNYLNSSVTNMFNLLENWYVQKFFIGDVIPIQVYQGDDDPPIVSFESDTGGSTILTPTIDGLYYTYFLTFSENGKIKVLGGAKQVETQTVVGTITTAGLINVTVTSNIVGTLPFTVSTLVGDSASTVAANIREELSHNTQITNNYIISGTGADVILTAKLNAANDDTLNIAYDNGAAAGLTASTTSVNTQIGKATSTFYSESIQIATSADIKIEWHNLDDAFGFHYTTDLINFMWIDGLLTNYNVKGKSTIFDNQGEEVKIKEHLYRTVDLVTEPVPALIAEKIAIAAAHDVFVINNVEWVTSSLPKIKQLGQTTMYEVTLTLTDRSALGINRYDVGAAYGVVIGEGFIVNNYVGVPTGTIYT